MARPGDVLHLHHNCVLLVGHGPLALAPPDPRLLPLHSFGEPDQKCETSVGSF